MTSLSSHWMLFDALTQLSAFLFSSAKLQSFVVFLLKAEELFVFPAQG